MESPPSASTWSEPFILSDDSGLLTCSSFSSGSMSGESRYITDMQDSDCEDKLMSQADSLDEMSDIICGENFNTLKKGPHLLDVVDCKHSSPIEPPLEFQDTPNITLYENLANNLIPQIISEAIKIYCKTFIQSRALFPMSFSLEKQSMAVNSFWTSDFLPFTSPPSSRRSLVSSRLSSSHNSLSVPSAHKVDDSSFIMQAVSHDTLVGGQISDIYNVPFDSDIYAVPADVVKQTLKQKRNLLHKKRRRNTSCCHELNLKCTAYRQNIKKSCVDYGKNKNLENIKIVKKRHSVAGSSANTEGEPIHMTLQEVRHYLQTLYSSSSESSVYKEREVNDINENNKFLMENNSNLLPNNKCEYFNQRSVKKIKRTTFLANIRNNQIKDTCQSINKEQILSAKSNKSKKSITRILTFKQTLCNLFNFRKFMLSEKKKNVEDHLDCLEKNYKPPTNRALPPLPSKKNIEPCHDFTTSIQKVKDYGWYWGPISSEAAEKILSNEPDGSFIVRDSSDDHYIFSLTFKLNNSVRHVRIEHDQGNFSFGSCTKFKSQTIVEFIENAVEHSRSGRYLFFLHRRPIIGPVRVQLLHPVSRFKQVQSLQHMCRFVILKLVRRDLLCDLPLPRRILDYLNTPHYYSEHLCEYEENNSNSNSFSHHTTSSQRLPRDNHDIITREPNVNANIPDENTSSVFANNTRQS